MSTQKKSPAPFPGGAFLSPRWGGRRFEQGLSSPRRERLSFNPRPGSEPAPFAGCQTEGNLPHADSVVGLASALFRSANFCHDETPVLCHLDASPTRHDAEVTVYRVSLSSRSRRAGSGTNSGAFGRGGPACHPQTAQVARTAGKSSGTSCSPQDEHATAPHACCSKFPPHTGQFISLLLRYSHRLFRSVSTTSVGWM